MSDIELDIGAVTEALHSALAEAKAQHCTHDAAQPAFKPSATGQINAARGAALAALFSRLHKETQRRFIALEQHTRLAQSHVAELAAGEESFATGVAQVGAESMDTYPHGAEGNSPGFHTRITGNGGV